MPELVLPTVGVHASFLAAMREFTAEGRGRPDDRSMLGRDLQAHGDRWADPAVFSEYLARVRADSREDTPRPDGFVPSTTWWWVDGQAYLGRLAIRHRLTPWLADIGGHLGYDVRPSARLRGHATAMLRASLPQVRALGIDPALVTCDEDNVGSRRVIEANGGAYEDTRPVPGAPDAPRKRRYWVPTSK